MLVARCEARDTAALQRLKDDLAGPASGEPRGASRSLGGERLGADSTKSPRDAGPGSCRARPQIID